MTRTVTSNKLLQTIAVALALAVLLLAAPGARAQSSPDQGPGGPVLVVTDPGDPFGTYYAEILRAEGLNEFAVTNTADLNAATLADYQVVVLAQTAVTDAQTTVLTNWVQGGGNLIAMRPDARLAGLLGLGTPTGTVSNGYIKVNTASSAGAGITADTMQIHGAADLTPVTDATTVATLYSSATASTSRPAVTLRSVGSAGGQAAAFTYDLARSIVATRQGNIAWAGQKRDGQINPIRSDDLFFPDWLDFSKVRIPQADEQQRLLANLITQMNLDRTPLPRFWYLPRGEKAAVVLTGDDHGHAGTIGQFNRYQQASQAGCSVADWQCVRSTSYVYPGTDITDAQAQAFQAAGFEIALHLSTDCADFTPASLADDWETQLPEFGDDYPSLSAPRTSRTHCIAWSDWASEPKVELSHGVRFDANYYYWPGAWVQDRPGMFTGSGFPMRFADANGSLIDVYQAATQLTDESEIDIDRHIQVLLDGALGSDGYYGVFTANMHTDDDDNPGADAIIEEAQARGVPVVSAVQMLDWLDGRNDSSFGDLSYDGTQLRFSVAPGSGARGLEAMIPVTAGTGDLSQLTRNGTRVPVTRRTVKGVDYRVFDAAAGSYVATYGPGDDTPPDTTVGTATVSGDSATVSFSSNESGAQFECRLDGGPFDSCDSPAHLTGLPDGSHTLTVRAIDLAGNIDPTPASTSFVTAGAPAQDTTPPDTTIAGATVTGSHARLTFSSNDTGAHFQCQLDGGAFAACTSPVDYNGLADGAHTFRAAGHRRRGQRRSDPGDAHLHHAGQRIDVRHDLPKLADPGRRRRVVAGRHGDGRRHGSARDRRQAHAARLGQGRRDRAGLVPAHRGQVPHRPAPEARRAPARARDSDGPRRQERECLPANEQERARKPGPPSHVDDRGHHDGTRRGRQPGNDQDPDPSPGAPTALGQPHQDRRRTKENHMRHGRFITTALVATAAMAIGPAWASAAPSPLIDDAQTDFAAAGAQTGTWAVEPGQVRLKLGTVAENFDARPRRQASRGPAGRVDQPRPADARHGHRRRRWS